MPPPRGRVCLRDIARVVGCHFSTVSLALRNHPRLPRETCERVQAAAKRLGYVPDPMLASLAHYRNSLRPVAYRATLAWVTNHPTADGWRDVPLFHAYFEGMRGRAEQLGYRVEEFWLRESGMTAARATQILGARGITGLVIAPQPSAGATVDLEWEKFSAVSIGYSLGRPNLHLVGPHQYRAIKLAMRELVARGYKRPGLVLLRASDDRVDQNWQAGYLVAQRSLAARDRLAPLLLENWNEIEFAEWLEARRPDVVLTKFAEVLPALRRRKVAVPRALGVAVLTHAAPGGDFAGVHENPLEVGAAAADYVTGMIHRNERGVPALPHRLLIDARWIEGRTIRATPARGAVGELAAMPA